MRLDAKFDAPMTTSETSFSAQPQGMQIIPSIDLWKGQVVRLRQGRYDEVTVYSDDPAELAASWSGLSKQLHIVDLAGAKDGKAVQVDLIRRIVTSFGPGVQIGGGVRSMETLERYLDLGVDRVVLGTAAVANPDLVAEATRKFPGQVVVALDAKNGYVATAGWLDVSSHRATDLAKSFRGQAVAALLYTDIERDGTEVGPNVEATASLARESGFPVIASGGVGTLDHLRRLAEANLALGADPATSSGICGAIIGRSLHEKRFSLREAIEAVEAISPA